MIALCVCSDVERSVSGETVLKVKGRPQVKDTVECGMELFVKVLDIPFKKSST